FVSIRAGTKQARGKKGQPCLGDQQIHAVLAGIRSVIACPTDFQCHGPSAFKPEQRDAVILHIEWLFRINSTLAPIRFTEAARPELGENLSRDRFHFEFSEQMQAQVQHVRAEVRRAAAAGELLLRKPGADARNIAAPEPKAARVIDLAQITALDDRFGGLTIAVEPEVSRE